MAENITRRRGDAEGKAPVADLDTEAAVLDAKSGALAELSLDAWEELLCAVAKFPTFPAQFCRAALFDVRARLGYLRDQNDRKIEDRPKTAASILEEELTEMMEAVLLGDLDAARIELVQSMAMLLRIYVHLPYYCAAAKGGEA